MSRHSKLCGYVARGLIAILAVATNANADDFLVDFEDAADGTVITNQYEGVTFDGIIIQDPFSVGSGQIDLDPDGSNTLALALDLADLVLPAVINFDHPVSNVSFRYASFGGEFTYTALDADGNIISQDTHRSSLQLDFPIDVVGTEIASLSFTFTPFTSNCCYFIDDFAFTQELVAPVEINIRPFNGTRENLIRYKGRLPFIVAVYGNEDVAAASIDPSTVVLGPNQTSPYGNRSDIRDINSDGHADLLLLFRAIDLGLDCGEHELTLFGETFAGDGFSGSDSVQVVGLACRFQ